MSSIAGQGGHGCNRAFFEIYGNGIYIGDSLNNNAGGVPAGAITQSGRRVCTDYNNTPSAITNTNTWVGYQGCRYSRSVISQSQAQAIANLSIWPE